MGPPPTFGRDPAPGLHALPCARRFFLVAEIVVLVMKEAQRGHQNFAFPSLLAFQIFHVHVLDERRFHLWCLVDCDVVPFAAAAEAGPARVRPFCGKSCERVSHRRVGSARAALAALLPVQAGGRSRGTPRLALLYSGWRTDLQPRGLAHKLEHAVTTAESFAVSRARRRVA